MTGTVATRQNLQENLQRRAAINRLYGKAKFWTGVSLTLALVAVLATIVDEKFDQIWVASVVAGVVMLTDQLWVRAMQAHYVKKAVHIQEDYDCAVLALPRDSLCPNPLRPQDVLHYVQGQHRRTGGLDDFLDWYPVRLQEIPTGPAALLAQRCSVFWTLSNLRQHSTLLLLALIAVGVLPFGVALWLNLSFQKSFLLILFPSVPFVVVLAQLHFQNVQAIRQLEALSDQLEDTWNAVVGQAHTDAGVISQARGIQNQLLELRKTLPLVPEWLHRLHQGTNETDMKDITAREVDRYRATWPIGP